MPKGTPFFPSSLLTVLLILASFLNAEASSHGNASPEGHLVQKHERKRLVQTEYGEISAVNVSDGTRGQYHLQFITLEPNSLFLPVLLHADMVFYVHTGSGTFSWTDDDELTKVSIREGDIYRLNPGSVFYLQSSLEPEREKLRIHAIFSNTEDNIYEPSIGAYSSISDLVTGFGSKVLQATFKVPEDVIEEILKATRPPAVIHAMQEKKKKKIICEWQARLLKAFLGSNRDGFDSINGKKKKKKRKTEAYNVVEADPDFKNCNGWSLTVDKRDSGLLSDSNIGVFMVNLTKGSMMGPHWNPRASEIAIVLQGQGMIRVACWSNVNESECKNLRFRVKEGDVFAVPRFHPMAQMSFNNDSFVFMGFSTSTKRNYPQFLAGKSSVLTALHRQILALSFNVTNATMDQLLTPQKESVILDCTSCAEEEESIMEEEIEREREEEEEEARKKEKEKERKRQEEEAKKREEEEARKRKEEEAKKREEEEKKRREEEARKEEEEARRQEEERQRRARKEEEERKRREKEEEEEKKEKEKERRGRKEEGEQEEPKRRKGEKGRQEGGRKREEAAAREQEMARREEEERQRRAEQEEEEARRKREKQGSEHGHRRVSEAVWEI